MPRAGIEPATRGFSRLVAKISFCFYWNKMSVYEVCEKLCNDFRVGAAGKRCGQHGASYGFRHTVAVAQDTTQAENFNSESLSQDTTTKNTTMSQRKIGLSGWP